jgi:Flavodoxin
VFLLVKTLVIYETKYGFTKEIARDAAMVLAPSYCSQVSTLTKDISKYGVVAICTPVYNDLLPQSIMEFVKENVSVLKEKKVILFCCCLEVDLGKTHLKPICELLGKAVIWQEIIGTRIEINHLDNNDYNDLKKVCEKDEISFKDNNLFIRERFLERLVKISRVIEMDSNKISAQEGIGYAEEFLKKHNTCALATGFMRGIRATPIEYTYRNGNLYLLSEGGQKFYYILQNPSVSVSIFDSFTSFEELSGMQIQGTAKVIEPGSEEYNSVINEKEIEQEILISNDIALYMIKIKIEKIEFEWSGFKKMGYDTKQVFDKL